MNIKTIIKILTVVASLAGVNSEQIKVVLEILNILAEDIAEATK
jgi:hypothetical protein